VPLRRTLLAFAGFFVLNYRAVHADIALTFDLKRRKIAAKIDSVTASARCLAANGAVTEIERIRMGGPQLKPHTPTVTGSFKQHAEPQE
jgi:hypothetical protein